MQGILSQVVHNDEPCHLRHAGQRGRGLRPRCGGLRVCGLRLRGPSGGHRRWLQQLVVQLLALQVLRLAKRGHLLDLERSNDALQSR